MIIESLGLCYHLGCFKVRLRPACRLAPTQPPCGAQRPVFNNQPDCSQLSFLLTCWMHKVLILFTAAESGWASVPKPATQTNESLFLFFLKRSSSGILHFSLLCPPHFISLHTVQASAGSRTLTRLFPPVSPQCIDCKSELGGSEAGAEVRIRNKQLYCNSCYMRFKSESTLVTHTCGVV